MAKTWSLIVEVSNIAPVHAAYWHLTDLGMGENSLIFQLDNFSIELPDGCGWEVMKRWHHCEGCDSTFVQVNLCGRPLLSVDCWWGCYRSLTHCRFKHGWERIIAENGVLIVVDCFKATDVASSMVALKRAHCMKHWQTKLET